MTGPLSDFEQLRKDLAGSALPFYKIDKLLEQIDTATRRLRGRTALKPPPPRAMVEGDLYQVSDEALQMLDSWAMGPIKEDPK